MYHNLYDLREETYGNLNKGVSQEDVDCVRTPNGDVYDITYAANLLQKIQAEFGEWIKNRAPLNKDGQAVYQAMRYLVKNSGGMIGQYLTDIPLAYQGGVDNDVVADGAEVVGDAQKTMKSALANIKNEPGATMRSMAKMTGDYRDSPDEKRVRAYQEKNPTSLEERILSRLINILDK